jgi:hypothetical protein
VKTIFLALALLTTPYLAACTPAQAHSAPPCCYRVPQPQATSTLTPLMITDAGGPLSPNPQTFLWFLGVVDGQYQDLKEVLTFTPLSYGSQKITVMRCVAAWATGLIPETYLNQVCLNNYPDFLLGGSKGKRYHHG